MEFRAVTFAGRQQNTGERFEETLEHQAKAFQELGITPVDVDNHEYRARFLPSSEDEIRLLLKDLKEKYDPTIIFTHYLGDPNQDHASVCQQVLRVFNDRTVLGGEISNSGHKLKPVVFVGLNEVDIVAKARALACYKAESHKYYFAPNLIDSLARVRGAQSGCFTFAEGFELYGLQTGIPPLR